MIYAVIERGPDAGTASSFETWDAYHAATFLAEIKAECERIARRAGLLREARENGIC